VAQMDKPCQLLLVCHCKYI